MSKGFGYVTVRMKFDYPDGRDVDKVFYDLVSEMDYSMTYDDEGVKITDTKIIGAQNAQEEDL